MQTYFLIDYLVYISVRLLSFILMRLPVNVALGIGRVVGSLGYYFDVRHKSIAYDNLRIAFASSKTPQEIKRIVKGLFQNFALSAVELLRLPIMNSEYFEKYIQIEGREHIEEALKKGKGLIFLAVHFGSWELSNIICANLNLTYKMMVREQKRFSRLNQLLNSYRQSQGTTVVVRGVTTREIVKSLHNNEVIGMVVDQGGKDGALVEFFGKDASIPTGAMRLALKLESPLLIAFIVRQDGPFHKVIIKPPLRLTKTGDLEQDTLINLKQVITTAQELISIYPEQYMWFYKIWKYSLTRSIIILSDGKAGHLRQAQAFSNLLIQQLEKRNINSAVKIININFKNKLAKGFVEFSSFLSKRRYCKGCLWCLKNCLQENIFQEIIKVSADFVISCGQSLAAVNFIVASENNAKSAVILNPGILGFKRFDLVVIPEHDTPPQRNNIVTTKGALNLISPDYLKEHTQSLLNSFPNLRDSQKLKIGLLLGGDSKKYVLTKEMIERVLREIKNVCQEFDLELLTTTSRRTSSEVEDVLKKEMADFERSKLLVIANENNHPFAVGAILGLAKIIIVSGESISMISEAVASGNTVIVFRAHSRIDTSKASSFGKLRILRRALSNVRHLWQGQQMPLSINPEHAPTFKSGDVEWVDFKRSDNRHEIFLQNMKLRGYIYLLNKDEIEKAVRDILINKKQTQKLDDNFIVSQALEKIL